MVARPDEVLPVGVEGHEAEAGHVDRRFVDDVPDDLVRYLPERFDASAFASEAVPLPLCGYYWAGEIAAGLVDLQGLGTERLLTLHYEDLLTAPHDTLSQLFGFILERPATAQMDPRIEALAGLIRRPTSDFRALPGATLHALERACRPGFEAIAAATGRVAA